MRLLIQILLAFTALCGLTTAQFCDEEVADICVNLGSEAYNACAHGANGDVELNECECTALYAEYTCYATCTDDPEREFYLAQLVEGCIQYETGIPVITADPYDGLDLTK